MPSPQRPLGLPRFRRHRLGRSLLLVLTFESNGTEIPEYGMPSLPVVEDLQVLEDGAVGVRVRRPVRLVREFDLERREETLRDRVVPAVAAPAHAQDNT